jgi:Ca2+-binding EF-hand superfamily protein
MAYMFSEKEMSDAFKVFNLKGDGNITANELFNIMPVIYRACTMEEACKMIATVDTDRDGMVGYNEFTTLFLNPL